MIDSNVVIDFFNGKLPEKARQFISGVIPEISIITNIELFASKNIPETELRLLQNFVSICTVHAINAKLIDVTIGIRQNSRVKLPDALIAATAITNNLVLLSRNTADFGKIIDLISIDPYTL